MCARAHSSAHAPESGGPASAAERRAAAGAVACDVALRLTDPERVHAAVRSAAERTHFPRSVHWLPYGVAQGDAGLALMCAQLHRCFPAEGWDVAAQQLLTSALSSAQRRMLPASLFGGLSGLGFAALSIAADRSRHERLSASIDDAIAQEVRARAQALHHRMPGVAVSEYDIISGLAGIGAYLLARQGRPAADDALATLLEALVDLVARSEGPVPAWLTPAKLLGDESIARRFPHGALNCGLAHGIPGPIALMALALTEDIDVAGLADATATATAWLVAQRVEDEWGVNWPSSVRPAQPSPPEPPGRAAWCYGAPGVSRALWLAGDALADRTLQALAVEALEAVHRRPVAVRNIDSPTFCHGVAGLLQITLRFARDTGLAVFEQAAADLTDHLLEAHDPHSLLGFCSVEPGGNRIDQAGLLDGAAGVALVLLSAATDVEPTWDRLFLLA